MSKIKKIIEEAKNLIGVVQYNCTNEIDDEDYQRLSTIEDIIFQIEKYIEKPIKTLNDLGYSKGYVGQKEKDVMVYIRKDSKGEDIVHIGINGYKNKFGCSMGDCVTLLLTEEEHKAIELERKFLNEKGFWNGK